MKFAKLEIKILISLIVAGYEYDVVDSEGNFPDQLPKPDYNDIHQVRLTHFPHTRTLVAEHSCDAQTRPLGDPCYIQFRRVVE